MLKQQMFPLQVIYDIETVPCLETARRVYPELEVLVQSMDSNRSEDQEPLEESEINRAVLDELYKIAGATEEDPAPFLKYFLHRVVSISGITRKQVTPSEDNPIGVELTWFSLPNGEIIPEPEIIGKFLKGVGVRKPQLVGWCSTMFDMPALIQRAMICGLEFPELQRPDKPWEGADYFGNGSDYNIDLMNLISSRSGQSRATLDEYARALKIPGKVGVSGSDTAEMWFNGQHRDIVNYNECDTATTYLIWLEMLRFSGHVLPDDYEMEKLQFRALLYDRIRSGADHLLPFAQEWALLQGVELPGDLFSSEVETSEEEVEAA